MKKRIGKRVKIPKTYISINKKSYRAVSPQKAISIARKLHNGIGRYKVHVVYGIEQISKRKIETIENKGDYKTANEAKQAILAFLDKSLWRSER